MSHVVTDIHRGFVGHGSYAGTPALFIKVAHGEDVPDASLEVARDVVRSKAVESPHWAHFDVDELADIAFEAALPHAVVTVHGDTPPDLRRLTAALAEQSASVHSVQVVFEGGKLALVSTQTFLTVTPRFREIDRDTLGRADEIYWRVNHAGDIRTLRDLLERRRGCRGPLFDTWSGAESPEVWLWAPPGNRLAEELSHKAALEHGWRLLMWADHVRA